MNIGGLAIDFSAIAANTINPTLQCVQLAVFSRYFLMDKQCCLTYTGTYSPVIQMEECDPCPAGETCPDTAMNYTIPCPAGFYCPEGSYGDGTPCPSGEF